MNRHRASRGGALHHRRTWGLAAALLALCVLPPAAQAQTKYQRKTKEIKVEQTDRTKKLGPQQGAAGPAGPDPSITADKFFGIQAALQQDYDALVATYKNELTQLGETDPMRLDYGFRLAETLAQQFRFYRSMSLEAQMKARTDWVLWPVSKANMMPSTSSSIKLAA